MSLDRQIADYTEHFLQTGQRPQNVLYRTADQGRFEGHPKQEHLARIKRQHINNYAHVPMTVPFMYESQHQSSLKKVLSHTFDVVLLNLPYELDPDRLYRLRIDQLCAVPSFLFIMCPDSSSERLNVARNLLHRWGFRRAEDIVWLKTNVHRQAAPCGDGIFQNSKEHCLMGIKGTVHRSSDGHLIHCNIDTDVIVAEELLYQGRRLKPNELYEIIENFCQGLRRLELFCNLPRPGWVSVDKSFYLSSHVRYNSHDYGRLWEGGHLLPQLPEIEQLRPQSPFRSFNRE